MAKRTLWCDVTKSEDSDDMVGRECHATTALANRSAGSFIMSLEGGGGVEGAGHYVHRSFQRFNSQHFA